MLKWLVKPVDELDGKDLVEITCVAGTIFAPAFALPIWAAFGVIKAAKPTAKAIAATARGTSSFLKRNRRPKPPPEVIPPPTKQERMAEAMERFNETIKLLQLAPLKDFEREEAIEDERQRSLDIVAEIINDAH